MKRKRLVFITGDDNGGVGIVEWRVDGNLNMKTFDPVAVFEEAMKAHDRWDEFFDQPADSLIYVFYPSGNPGLLMFTTEFENTPGKPYRMSRVTEMQTSSGMVEVTHG